MKYRYINNNRAVKIKCKIKIFNKLDTKSLLSDALAKVI